jgi:hypothetical protein
MKAGIYNAVYNTLIAIKIKKKMDIFFRNSQKVYKVRTIIITKGVKNCSNAYYTDGHLSLLHTWHLVTIFIGLIVFHIDVQFRSKGLGANERNI